MPSEEPNAKPRVLIVEDEKSLRVLLRELLLEEGFSVGSAPTCDVARMMVMNDLADVVLSDIRLPDGSGLALCEEISKARPWVGIVLMSGFPNQEIPAWVHEKKIPLVHKPCPIDELAQTIRAACAKLQPSQGAPLGR